MAALGFDVLTPLPGNTAADAISIYSSAQGDAPHDDDWSWMTNSRSASGDSWVVSSSSANSADSWKPQSSVSPLATSSENFTSYGSLTSPSYTAYSYGTPSFSDSPPQAAFAPGVNSYDAYTNTDDWPPATVTTSATYYHAATNTDASPVPELPDAHFFHGYAMGPEFLWDADAQDATTLGIQQLYAHQVSFDEFSRQLAHRHLLHYWANVAYRMEDFLGSDESGVDESYDFYEEKVDTAKAHAQYYANLLNH
ncbi:hypothetical protein [Absidia glauca]|uniref:Uncharacterized protein n=1 Tax=Absidia glauca TaxID=4829 RepID=A0A163L1H1_ABSGL|nr:hypothetical protein [Absidia glauca]